MDGVLPAALDDARFQEPAEPNLRRRPDLPSRPEDRLCSKNSIATLLSLGNYCAANCVGSHPRAS